MDIAFPLKGWNTNAPRNAIPEGYAFDMLNALPFDGDDRMRGASRPGLSKFDNTQLGAGDQPVLLAASVTRALNSSEIQPSDTLLSYDVSGQANGTVIHNLDLLPVDSIADWKVYRGTSTFGDTNFEAQVTGTGNQYLDVKSGYIRCENTFGNDKSCPMIYQPTISLGSAYILRVTAKGVGTQGSGGSPVRLYARVNKTTPDANGVTLTFYRDVIRIRVSGTATTHSFASTLADQPHVVELKCAGDVFTAWVDGVKYVTVTTTSNSAHSGVGIGISSVTDGQGVATFLVFSSDPLAVYRETSLVAVCGGNIYAGTKTASLTAVTGGTSVLSETIKPQMAAANGTCYFVDGVHDLITLDLSTRSAGTLTVSEGSETASTLGLYQIACMWRGRLILGNATDNPQNFVASRQGDVTDWDYSQADAGAAWAGNASEAGSIGDPINCIVPWSTDVLFIGGDHTINLVEGDIADGGRIVLVSEAIGTLGPNAACVDPAGNLYFVGTGGLYRMRPGSHTLENLAEQTVRNYFTVLNRAAAYYMLAWDRDRNGLWICATPVNSDTALHLFWDATTGGFFRIQFPETMGPTAISVFDGDEALDRAMLLGGRDGYVRQIDQTALDDDGTAISSYVSMGPFRPAGDAALAVLQALEVIMGDQPDEFDASDFECQLTIQTGKDALTAHLTPERSLTVTFDETVRRKRLLQRLSGGSWIFTIVGVANKFWSLEKLIALFTEGGLQRRY